MTTPNPKWTYGKEGTAFDVEPGQVWEVGDYVFVCSDLMTSTLYTDVLKEHTPTLLYSDPPWGNALLNGFRTKAGLAKATYDVQHLYMKISSLGHERDIPIYLEGSKPDHRDGVLIPPTMEAPGYDHQWGWYVTYGKKNAPSGLYYCGKEPVPPVLVNELTGVNDVHLPGKVMRAYGPSGVVIDPCSGRGVTSREAFRSGWTSVLNELNPARMSAALARAEKEGMGTARKVAG